MDVTNLTVSSNDMFQRCWKEQGCKGCLRQDFCSWCPSTSSCVPNTHQPQILAPIWEPNICPDNTENWEIRTRSLGCHCSTITLFTCIISVLSTFVVIGLVGIGVRVTRRLQASWVVRSDNWRAVWSGSNPAWWKGWGIMKSNVDAIDEEAPEQRPLLAREQV